MQRDKTQAYSIYFTWSILYYAEMNIVHYFYFKRNDINIKLRQNY